MDLKSLPTLHNDSDKRQRWRNISANVICKLSLREGYYIYIPLNNFVGSTFSMASLVLHGTTLSLPVPHSLRQASTFRILPITFPLADRFFSGSAL